MVYRDLRLPLKKLNYTSRGQVLVLQCKRFNVLAFFSFQWLSKSLFKHPKKQLLLVLSFPGMVLNNIRIPFYGIRLLTSPT